MAESRFRSHLRRKAIHNVFFVLFGIIIIIVVVFIFGDKLLIEFSLLMEKNENNAPTTTTGQGETYIAPPTLNPAVTATNSAQITISGYAQKNQKITLYLNSQQIDTTTVDGNNNFQFPSETLQNGQNTLQAKASGSNNMQSDYSNSLTILYLKNPPSLTIAKPSDGQTFSKGSTTTVSVAGTTDPNVKVTVNGFWAIIDAQGNYSYLYTVSNGDNDIKVIATDEAGNQTTKEIHIHVQ